jgi:plastocyanin
MPKSLLNAITLALFAAVASACGEPQAEVPPPAEATAPQGVYGVAPAAVGGTPSVVTLDPVGPSGDAPGAAAASGTGEPPTMDQLGLVFTPPTLVARVGEPVAFTNSEALVHNVHVQLADNDSTVLNVETDPGARAEFVFDRAGGYDVTCDHHPGMRAFVYVTEAEHAVFADNAGNFLIPDVAPGAYDLSVWSIDPQRRLERRIEVSGPSTEVTLAAP